MSITNQVEQLLRDVQTLPLSQILPSVLSLALECDDYEGYCVISYLIYPISKNAKTNMIQSKEIKNTLFLKGLSEDRITKILKNSQDKVIELKTVASNQTVSHNVKEMEDCLLEMKKFSDTLSGVSQESYQELYSTITQIGRVYETVRSYVTSKLTYYQQMIKMMKPLKSSSRKSKEDNCFNMEKIFIVHGHNGEMKEAVARLVEKQGIKAIILHEQANRGATIIEKIESNSDVGCAICLFTADDIGRSKVQEDEKNRARQNVVFEAGYFIGKLGRENVVIIADQEIEMPSDLQGVVYLNSDYWRFSVLKELKTIGYAIDYNVID